MGETSPLGARQRLTMPRDIRDSDRYRRAEALHASLWGHGSGRIADAADLAVAADELTAWFTATIFDADGKKRSRIAQVDLESGAVQLVGDRGHTDRMPAPAPKSSSIAFLSDRSGHGEDQLCLFDRESGVIRLCPPVEGSVEHLSWSPDGGRLLLGIAGRGTDRAGAQGAVARIGDPDGLPDWMPRVDSGASEDQCRFLAIYDPANDRLKPISAGNLTIWEACWCGDRRIAAIASERPDEGGWYGAALYLIDLATEEARLLFNPTDQLGVLVCSPDGDRIACVEAICSDRGVVAGELRLIHPLSGQIEQLDLPIDASTLEWRGNHSLLVAGHRGLDSVVGTIDVRCGRWRMSWRSQQLSSGGIFMTAAGLGEDGDCVFISEGFAEPPHLVLIRAGEPTAIVRFGPEHNASVLPELCVELVRWTAPDGLEIEGIVLQPFSGASGALVMNIHGGPIWHWRTAWLGRTIVHAMLLEEGCSIFLPNPRGSTGRGQSFVRPVVGDMGGADAADLLTGLDHLIARGIARPHRVGVIGRSYGGFMTYRLAAGEFPFAAAVAISPMSNFVTQRLVSNIPDFCSNFLTDDWTEPAGDSFSRSPLYAADRVGSPVLSVCGALDRCTPAIEAVQFHRALMQAENVKSVLLTYPREGHGVRSIPAEFDYAARVVEWFTEHLPARCDG